MGDVAGTVVGHDGLDAYAVAAGPGDGASEEGDRAGGSLIGQHLSVSQTRSVIDGDMDELPSDASNPNRMVSMDAMSDQDDPSEFFDVDVNELAGPFSLVAHEGFFGIQAF